MNEIIYCLISRRHAGGCVWGRKLIGLFTLPHHSKWMVNAVVPLSISFSLSVSVDLISNHAHLFIFPTSKTVSDFVLSFFLLWHVLPCKYMTIHMHTQTDTHTHTYTQSSHCYAFPYFITEMWQLHKKCSAIKNYKRNLLLILLWLLQVFIQMLCCFYPIVIELLALFYDPAGFSDLVVQQKCFCPCF